MSAVSGVAESGAQKPERERECGRWRVGKKGE